MSITLGLIGAGVGLASSLYGAHKSAQSAKEQERELAQQRAAGEAWYNRNYYQDYLNTVEAQNALKRVRNAWDERTREARARQAITGGTPEQAQAVAEAGGEAMGETVGNLAAQGQQNKAAIDAQKLAMDMNLSQQAAQIAENKQQAAQQLMAGGASMITSGLQSMGGMKGAKVSTPKSTEVNMPTDVKPLGEIKPPKIDVPNNTTAKRPPIGIPMKDTKLELPDKVQELNIPPIAAPKKNAEPIVAGNGKMAGINPELNVSEDEYYSKNRKNY